MTYHIEFWGDFTCPFSYIGFTDMSRAIKNLDMEAEIHMHPYELNPNMKPGVWESTMYQMIHKDGMTEEEAAEKIKAVQAYAKECDVPMDFAKEKFANTRDAHRMVYWAQKQDQAKADDLIKTIYHTNFVLLEPLDNKDTLLKCAEQAGFSREQAKEILDSDQFEKEVVQQETWAREHLESIPYFKINDLIIPSSNPTEVYEKLIQEHFKLSK